MTLELHLGDLHRRVLKLTHGAEHYAAVAYSSVEVFQLHHVIWYVSLSLVVFGIGAVIYDKMEI